MKFHVDTWFERDRAYLSLEDENGKVILEFWDDEVNQVVEDGFINPKDYLGSMIEYAEHLGLIR